MEAAAHPLLSGDLPPLGLGQLHLTVPGRDLAVVGEGRGGGGSVSEDGRRQAPDLEYSRWPTSCPARSWPRG